MLYLGIDQHKDQLTINLRNEQGEVVQKGQIKTVHVDIDDFFGKLRKKARKCRGFMAIVEVLCPKERTVTIGCLKNSTKPFAMRSS